MPDVLILKPPSSIAAAVEEASFAGVILLIRSLGYTGKFITSEEFAEKLKNVQGCLPYQPAADRRPIILDARRKDEWEESHIWGALHVHTLPPPMRLQKHFVARVLLQRGLSGVEKDREIICYCAAGLRSSRLVMKLRKAGFSRVFLLREGLYNWVNAGFPLYNAHGEERTHIRAQHWLSTVLIHDKEKILQHKVEELEDAENKAKSGPTPDNQNEIKELKKEVSELAMSLTSSEREQLSAKDGERLCDAKTRKVIEQRARDIAHMKTSTSMSPGTPHRKQRSGASRPCTVPGTQ